MKTFQMSFKNDKWSENFPADFDSANSLLFAYFSPALHAHSVWKELKNLFPQSKFMGCSGAGEVKQSEICDHQIILTGIKFEKTKIEIATIKNLKGRNSEDVGEDLGKLFPKSGLSAMYLLSDGLAVNGTALIKGLTNTLGHDLNLSGGLAGDGADFKNTFVLVDGQPTENAATAVAFYGDNISMNSSAQGGWITFGLSRTITKSEANVLYELDGKPALELYKQFLGEQAKKLPSSALLFPIYLISGADQVARNAVRTILSVDEKNQSMTFAGDVPVGSNIQLMRASHEDLIKAAKIASSNSAMKLDHSIETVSLIVSCVGRRLVLGENTENEIEEVLQNLPKNTTQTGFYSYGEIAPGNIGFCDLHNQTMTITLIQEKL
ncbi:MAG: FIST signal transduction protein [Bacteriovoracaceae bacterium]